MGKASHKKPPSYRRAPPSSKLPPMSGVLMDLVAPLYHEDMPLETYRTLIGYAAIAWTLALFPKEQRKQQLQAFFKAVRGFKLTFDEIVAAGSDEEVTEEPRPGMNAVELIKALVHRKERLFPGDNRILREWDVFYEKGQYRVIAGYLPPEAPADNPALNE